MENKKEKAYRTQKVTLYWLLGIIYSAFIGLQLGNIQAITDFDYTLHEMMFLPLTIATFIVPVLLPIYIILLIRYLLIREKRQSKINIKSVIKISVVIVSLIFVFSITHHQFMENETYGVFEVNKKIEKEGKYYITIDEKRIQVSRNEYNLITNDTEYFIGYSWNRKTHNKGKLKSIEPIEKH